MTVKRLPVEGALLEELRVFGNGKDCCVRMETSEPHFALHFDMRDPSFQIDLHGKVQCTIFSDGSDKDVGVRYRPLEPLLVRRFTVDYPGTDRAWRRVLQHIRKGHSDACDWMLRSVALTIVPAGVSEPSAQSR